MLTDKNTEILDIEEKYRSGLAEDPSWVHPSKKYKEATKEGVSIPPEMRMKHCEEIGKDADALQIMMDNIKKTFALKDEAKEGFVPDEKPNENQDQMTLDSGIKDDNPPSKEGIYGPWTNLGSPASSGR